MKTKKGVSPVVATVLLIMLVIILAIIILLWSQGFVKEIVSKEIAGTEKRVEKFCEEVKLNPIINSNDFGFENTGNVPLYKYNLRLSKSGDTEVHTIDESINPGFVSIIKDYNDYENWEEIEVIPILLGKTEDGATKEFECPDSSAINL